MPIGFLELTPEFTAWKAAFFNSSTSCVGSASAAGRTVILEHGLFLRGGKLEADGFEGLGNVLDDVINVF